MKSSITCSTSPALMALGWKTLAASLALVPLANGAAAVLGGTGRNDAATSPALQLVGDAVELATGGHSR